MRKLIFILIALISFSQAQTIQYIGAPTTTVISRGNFRTDSIFYLPKRTKTPTDTAAFRYQISDSSLYYWTGYQWTKVQSSSSFASVDTTVISTRLWRQKGIDSVQYNVGLKVNISDTSTMLSPYIRHAGYGLTKSGQALIVDTLNIATKAWRQKGDDSLGAIIATKGSGTVTSVATGYGLSGGTITTTGTLIADTALIATRLRVGKVVDSLSLVKQNVLTNPVTGTGTLAYIPKFTGTSTIGNSLIYDNGSQILINTTSSGGGYTFRVNGSAETTGNTFLGSSAGKVLMNYTSASPAELRVHNTAADNQQLILSNNGTYHTGFIASQVADVLSDSYAWGMFGGVNSYITGTSYAVGIALGSSVPHFQVTRHNNLNGGVTQNLMRITSAGEVFINTTTDAGAYTLQNNGALYNTGSAILAATSGSVGIGLTSPISGSLFDAYKVTEAVGYIRTANQTLRLTASDANSSVELANAAGGVIQFTQGTSTERARINTSGEFLFGTTTDAGNYRVQVSGNAYVSDNLYVGTTTSTLPFEVSTGGAAGLKTVTRFGASGNGGAGRGSKFILGAPGSANSVDVAEFIVYQNSLSSTANDGVFALTTANSSGTLTERFRITNVGRFGLGNNNPQSLMHVSGNILSYTEVANTASLFIAANATNNFQIGMGAGAYMVITEGGGLNSLGTERFRFHANGGLKYVPQSAAPTAEAGTVYYDSDDNKLKVYNGTTWVDLH